MTIRLAILSLFLLFILAARPAAATGVTPTTNAPAITAGTSLTGFPLVFYTPEMSLSLTAIGVLTSRGADDPTNLRPDSVMASAFATLKGQCGLALMPDLFFDRERWELRGLFSYTCYTALFYGLGPATSSDDDRKFTTGTLIAQPSLLYRLTRGLYVGINATWRTVNVAKLPSDGVLAAGAIAGSRDNTIFGAGPMLEWDTRDHGFSPTRGVWLKYASSFYAVRENGATDDAAQHTFDFRFFTPLAPGHVLAAQAVVATSSRSLPFDMFTQLKLRGIVEDRFRDRSLAYLQLEYRFPIAGNFSGVAFAGAGNVSDGLDRFSGDGLKLAGGLGLRYALDPAERINVRLDIGVSKWDIISPYVLIQECF